MYPNSKVQLPIIFNQAHNALKIYSQALPNKQKVNIYVINKEVNSTWAMVWAKAQLEDPESLALPAPIDHDSCKRW